MAKVFDPNMAVSSLKQIIQYLILYKDSTGKAGLCPGSVVSVWLL